MNWLNLCIEQVISGLEMVRDSNLPSNLMYIPASFNNSPSSLLSLRLTSMGVLTGLQPSILTSLITSNAYFLWHNEMPFSDLATSKPKKYFRFPRSFNLNCFSNTTSNCYSLRISASNEYIINIYQKCHERSTCLLSEQGIVCLWLQKTML